MDKNLNMPKIFLLVPHNNPSGGGKVANQIVNLFKEKGYESFLVITENSVTEASFMKNPAPVMTLDNFKNICTAEDVVMTFWQSQIIHEAIKNCPAQKKIFWQHGVIIPKYSNFNGEEIFTSKVYGQIWNVSKACADYIKEKYKIPEIKIIHPFFDDETLSEYAAQKNESKREGILVARRRGQEAIPDIIRLFPEQKITVLPKTFSDSQLYEQLIKHKIFISTDNGVDGVMLIKNKFIRQLKTLKRAWDKIFRSSEAYQSGWIKPEKNLLGFPVTAAEAAWLGTVVVAFAMGGGLEWMTPDNCYLAQDNNPDSLFDKIRQAVEDNKENRVKRTILAEKSVEKFNQENTWKQLSENLEL
jgi:glycosyltransferase involved in cell wall biosynthesis